MASRRPPESWGKRLSVRDFRDKPAPLKPGVKNIHMREWVARDQHRLLAAFSPNELRFVITHKGEAMTGRVSPELVMSKGRLIRDASGDEVTIHRSVSGGEKRPVEERWVSHIRNVVNEHFGRKIRFKVVD